MLIPSNPRANAGRKYRSKNDFRSRNLKISCNSTRLASDFTALSNSRTWGVTWGAAEPPNAPSSKPQQHPKCALQSRPCHSGRKTPPTPPDTSDPAPHRRNSTETTWAAKAPPPNTPKANAAPCSEPQTALRKPSAPSARWSRASRVESRGEEAN